MWGLLSYVKALLLLLVLTQDSLLLLAWWSAVQLQDQTDQGAVLPHKPSRSSWLKP